MPSINIVAAISENGAIGINNQLPWSVPEDTERFRKLTTGHPVIMGRRTFQSLNGPLPERDNIVVTSKKLPGAICVQSLPLALSVAEHVLAHRKKIFIIGGARIYAEALQHAHRIYLTIMHCSYPCADTYFPSYDHLFKELVFKSGPLQSEEAAQPPFSFLVLDKFSRN